MAIIKYNMKIPKMDYQVITVSLLENGVPTKLKNDDLLFMTVRKSSNSEEMKFQKSLNNGIFYNEELQRYEIEITNEDTKDLTANTSYGYDITVYYDGNKPKQKVTGKLTIAEKYTLNEVIV